MATLSQWSSLATVPPMAGVEMDITTFYDELSSFARHILKHNVVIISGDTNTQISKDQNNKI